MFEVGYRDLKPHSHAIAGAPSFHAKATDGDRDTAVLGTDKLQACLNLLCLQTANPMARQGAERQLAGMLTELVDAKVRLGAC